MKNRRLILLILPGLFLMGSISINAQSKIEEEREKARQYEEQAKAEEKRRALIEEGYRVREAARESARSSYVTSSGNDFFFVSQGSSSSSQLSLTKAFEGESVKNKGTFEVDENVKNISLNLNGAVKSGKIKIKIILADGQELKEMTIDNSADIQYNQNIRISDEEKKYFGPWTYIIEADEAKGRYRLMINTN